MKKKTNMYDKAKTWNPFRGCRYDCIYCDPSFKRQAKRLKQLCLKCHSFEPHWHPDKLSKIPSSEIVFVCGYADISFCPPEQTRQIIKAIKADIERSRK